MNIGRVEVGPDQPVAIVAEIGTSHNGSLLLARRLIREVAAAGATFVKFQCYTVDEMLALRGDGPAPEPWAGQTLGQLYAKARTPLHWFVALSAEAHRARIPWFSSAFGEESIRTLSALGCPAYKVAALDSGNQALRDAVIRTGRPVITSHPTEVQLWADATLYCPPGYPQDWGEEEYRMDFHGLSYHGKNTWVPKWLSPVAPIIEVHVEADDAPSELDSHSSLTVSQLRELCEAVR